jgi:excisionase family DNA binding protein
VEPLMTAREVAEHLRVTESAIRKWARERKLPALRAGRRVRFREEDVLRFLQDR